jgi:hypothetical protein
VTTILKKEERQVDHKADGRINMCNPEQAKRPNLAAADSDKSN